MTDVDCSDEAWATVWADWRTRWDVTLEMERVGDTPELEAAYRAMWEVGRRMMARPGFIERLREKQSELNRKYGTTS